MDRMPTDTLPAVDELEPEDLDELVGAWLDAQRMPSTRELYRSAITLFRQWCHGRGINVLAASQRDINRYRQHLARPQATGRCYANSTQHLRLSAVSSFYRHAAAEGAIEHNPVENVKRPPLSSESPREPLTLDQARRLLSASVGKGPRTAALVHLLLSTAMRVSEACSADTRDLGWSNGNRVRTVKIVRKGGKPAIVRIQPRFWAVIEEYLETRKQGPTGPLLLTERGQMDRNTAWSIVVGLAAEVLPGVPVSPHILRQTAATLMLNAGAPMQEVQAVLGHSTPAMTQRYDGDREHRGQIGSAMLGDALLGEGTEKGEQG